MKSSWEGGGQVIQLLLEEDLVLGDVSEDKGNLSLILWVVEDGTDELVHWGNTSSTGNQGEVLVEVGRVWILWKRTLELELVSWLESVDVCRHWSSGVFLNEEIEIALGILIVDWGVRAEGDLLVTLKLDLGQDSGCYQLASVCGS